MMALRLSLLKTISDALLALLQKVPLFQTVIESVFSVEAAA